MQQKELKDCSQEVFRSFKTNKLLTQSLRQPLQLGKQENRRFSPDHRFMSGKEYVKMARLELINQPTKVVNQEETLKSKPNKVLQQRTKNMIENQIKSRRERHLTTLENFEHFEESFQLDELTKYKEIQQTVTKTFKKFDVQMETYFASLKDEVLLKKETEFIEELNDKILTNKREREESIQGLDKKFKKALIEYQQKINNMMDMLENDLSQISFILEPEILVLKQTMMDTFHVKVKSITDRNKIFLEKVDKDQKISFNIFQEQQLYFEIHWRKLKHNQSIESFKSDIQQDEYVWPQKRERLYEVSHFIQKLNEMQTLIFENRKNLVHQLQHLQIQNLAHSIIEQFQKDLGKLNDFASTQYDELTKLLLESVEQGKNKTNERLQKLRSQLELYASVNEEKLGELMETEFIPIIAEIQQNDKTLLESVLNYQDNNDYISQETVLNISNYYDIISKKLDKFRKDYQDLQLKYEVEKAKAADQNDDELDKINDRIEELKQQIRQTIHHPQLEEQLKITFDKVDEYQQNIRQFHETNLNIARSHPEVINQIFRTFESDCAPIFKMAPEHQKAELEAQMQNDFEEKIKAIIAEEEAEKEREAIEQAAKKGGKAPAKKDGKKAQQEYDSRFAELSQELQREQVEEFLMGGRTWVQFQKITTIIEDFKKIQDSKSFDAPTYREKLIISDNCYFNDEMLLEIIYSFRKYLFQYIQDQLNHHLEMEKKDDQIFVENSLILLDERLKLNYPIKGQIEVELYQTRSSQITEHKSRYDRHARAIIDKNINQTQEYNHLMEECMRMNTTYVDFQNNLKEELPNSLHLSKLQGMQNQGREKYLTFQIKMEDMVQSVYHLAVECPDHLMKQNKIFIQSLKDNHEYSEGEVEWYQNMINDIDKDVQEQQTAKKQRYEEIKTFLAKNHKESFEALDAQYKISQEELAQKDGTGKQYGRPKRLAQEKVRLEMTKCEDAASYIASLMEKIANTVSSSELRQLMIILRNCITRYAFHIDALNEKAPEMIRFSRDDNRQSHLILPEEVEADKLLQETEQELLGPLSYQADKTKKFSMLVLDIEKAVKDECQKIYQGPSAKWLNGQDKLPDWIRPYLENIKKNMHNFRINCCLNLREMIVKFQDLAPKINEHLFYSLLNDQKSIQDKSISQIRNDFTKLVSQNLEIKETHSRELRPNLFNPACKKELDNLIEKEKVRSQTFQDSFTNIKNSFYDIHFGTASTFFTKLLNNFEFLLAYYDSMILFEDFNYLPGDENIAKKKQNLSTLLKLKQEGKQIDYNSQRSIQKTWNGMTLDVFNIGEREFKYQQMYFFYSSVVQQEEVKGKGKDKGKAQEQNQQQSNATESKQIKSFKTPCQKTAKTYKQQIFDDYKNTFNEFLNKQNKLFENAEIEEQKYNIKWSKSLEDLFK